MIATRAIEVGEELNDSYIHLLQSKADRKSQLYEIYGFDCQCRVCTQSDSKLDDAKRVKAAELEDLIIETAAESGPEVAIQLSLDLIRLLNSEAAASWGERYRGKPLIQRIPGMILRTAGAYFSAYMLLQALHRSADALRHVREAFTLSRLYEGERSPQTLRCKAILEAEGGACLPLAES